MKNIRIPLAAAAVAALLPLAGAQAETVGFMPSSPAVNLGDVFNLTVRGTGFGSNVDGGGFNLAFDPAVLRVEGITFPTPPWEFFTSPGTIDNAAGTVQNASFNTFANVVNGDFTIGTVSLRAVGLGASVLDLGPSASFPFASQGQALEVTFVDGRVNVVPEPETYLLLLAGLGVLGAIVRRRAAA